MSREMSTKVHITLPPSLANTKVQATRSTSGGSQLRTILPERLELGRHMHGHFGSRRGSQFGAFLIQGPCGDALRIIASGACDEAEGWEHVSISCQHRCPVWEEMAFVKDLFWDEEECVIQFHPPKSEYVNCHPHCLHLWKPPFEVPTPPSILVGLK